MKELKAPRRLLPKQAEILNSKARYRYYSGAFGSGKTLLGCHLAITHCLTYPRNFWLMGCLTFPMLEDTVQRTFFEELELYQKMLDEADMDIKLVRKWNETKKHLYFFNGSEVIFRSLEKATQAYAKFKSLNLGGFYIDEPVDINHDVFRMLQGRLRLPDVPHVGVMGGNPSTKSNWVYKTFFEDYFTDKDYLVVNTSSLDNPYLPREYMSDLQKWASTDEAYYNRYVLGKWGALEGLVYSTFNRDVHVIEPFEIPEEWERYRGIDFGVRNPFACVWVAVDHDGRYYVYDEHYLTETLLGDHKRIIDEKTGDQRIKMTFADPSGRMERMELAKMGLDTVAGDNDVMLGIQAVQKLMRLGVDSKPSFYVFNTCRNLINELESYRWVVSRGVVNEKEMPHDKDNHLLDSMRYIVFSLSQEVPLETIGDLTDLLGGR